MEWLKFKRAINSIPIFEHNAYIYSIDHSQSALGILAVAENHSCALKLQWFGDVQYVYANGKIKKKNKKKNLGRQIERKRPNAGENEHAKAYPIDSY